MLFVVWTLTVWTLPASGQDAKNAVNVSEGWFVEEAREAGLDFVHWNGMSGQYYFPEVVGSGGALFDYDGDGDLDLYLVQGQFLGGKIGGKNSARENISKATFPPPGELPLGDRLYRNDLTVNAAGESSLRFTDVTAASGIRAQEYGMGVAVGDYDNDGWPDLYVTNFGPNQLWRNRGPGPGGQVTFEEVSAEVGVEEPRWSIPASFVDLDGDGWLDLFVGNYVEFAIARNKSCLAESGLRDYCGPSTYRAESDRLFRNLGPKASTSGTSGKVRFEDLSKAAGFATAPGPTMGLATADFNGDGRLDLYVAHDLAPNQLWLQEPPPAEGGLRFVDDALLLGCAVNEAGAAEASMGVDAADVDGDGDEDLFMTHLNRESNTLYLNDGSGLFRDRSLKSGLANPSWTRTGFGTAFFDYDNDGWLDLYTANGTVYILFELARQGEPYPLHQKNQLFRHLGPSPDGVPRFEEVSARAGAALEISEVSRGTLVGDLDNDGDTDLIVTNNSGPVRLLRNLVGQNSPWLGVRLLVGPRDDLGARAVLHRPGLEPLWRRVRGDGSYASANDPRLLFGLGGGAAVERVDVHWTDGSVESFRGLSAGEYHTLRRGTGEKPPAP